MEIEKVGGKWDLGRNTTALLEDQYARQHYICVGLDSRPDQIVPELHRGDIFETVMAFNEDVIDAVIGTGVVASIKINLAPYFAQGHMGIMALEQSMRYIHRKDPRIVTILDAKFSDILDTNMLYALGSFDVYQADAVTVAPLPGRLDLLPFLERKDKVTIILCHMSGKGAPEFQDMMVGGMPFYKVIARNVSGEWNNLGNCMLVLGATYPEQIRETRQIIGDMGILSPGIGKQDGDKKKTIQYGLNSQGGGLLIVNARGIIFAKKEINTFASAAAEETIKLHETILQYAEA